MDGSENNCLKCSKYVGKDECIKCDVCQRLLHKVCVDLTASELKCMPLQKRSLWFLCDLCVLSLKKMPLMIDMIEEIKKSVDQMKKDMHNSSTEPSKQSYSNVLKTKPEQVLVVKPRAEQESRLTKNDVEQAIDPAEIGVNISKIKEVSKGAIIIGCDNTEDRNILHTKINEKMHGKYNVEVPNLKKPKLRIANINNEDIEKQDNETIQKIIKQNKIQDQHGEYHMKILKVIKNKKKNCSTIIMELDPKTHSCLLSKEKVNIGWSRGYVNNHVSVLQCFKCLGFNHLAKDCKENQFCSFCSDKHAYKECTSKEAKCINCKKAKNNLNIELNWNHSALDKNCPCYLRLLKKRSERIEYLEE